ETVQLLGKNQAGTWYLITDIRGVTGWVSVTLLTIDPNVRAAVPIRTETAVAAASTPPPDGYLATRVPDQPTNTPLPDDQVPPSLAITKLVPFTHQPTGISGLRPDNWTLFSGPSGFQISSSPEAPDGFVGSLIPPDKLPPAGAEQAMRATLDPLKKNQADGPPPEILEEKTLSDGSHTLLVANSGHAQGSTRAFRFMTYARTTVTGKGLLLALA